MYEFNKAFGSIRKNVINSFGWSTNRKIIVIESDDWGSIRTCSKKNYDIMLSKGLELDKNTFTMYDALESNDDLENLFNVLINFKDFRGRHPVFTPMCIVGNPEFKKIKESDFQEYYYEPFPETCKMYPNHDRVLDLYRKGIEEHIFVPALHGREHLNANRWLRLLKNGNEGLLLAFNNSSIGGHIFKGKEIPMYLGTYDPEFKTELFEIEDNIKDSSDTFKNLFGFYAEHFIEPNEFGPKIIEKYLSEAGVKYLLRAKLTRYSLGNNTHGNPNFCWVGKKNQWGQTYLTRNCTFEPHNKLQNDWVESCLKDISVAFRWHKPAIIISHRVSYIGHINSKNAANGLKELNRLLSEILKKWPDVEFLTSMELGNLISS